LDFARTCAVSDAEEVMTVQGFQHMLKRIGVRAKTVGLEFHLHENMTLAEEKALLMRFAKAAGAGEMLNVHDLKAAYEKAIGHATSDSTVYNLLHRHGWRKLMPRPFHPKRDLAAQNAFKKTAFLML
jgi:transposase